MIDLLSNLNIMEHLKWIIIASVVYTAYTFTQMFIDLLIGLSLAMLIISTSGATYIIYKLKTRVDKRNEILKYMMDLVSEGVRRNLYYIDIKMFIVYIWEI